MILTRTPILYAVFAGIATLANLGGQRIVLLICDGTFGLILALISGTLLGLVIKYVLDKRWIFQDRSTGLKAHGQRFTLYTAMGLVTTALFWASETAFWLVWETHQAREIGAILGLGAGYVLKFHLDRRFVFSTQGGLQ